MVAGSKTVALNLNKTVEFYLDRSKDLNLYQPWTSSSCMSRTVSTFSDRNLRFYPQAYYR